MRLPSIEEILEAKEGENFEFKEAKNDFSFERLAEYVCAIANAGGGYIILGITDKRPREVVGSKAFEQPERTLQSFSTEDFFIVDLVHREQPVPVAMQNRLPKLLDLGIIERVDRGKFMLAKRYYVAAGKKGVYTRKRWLDRETQKALLLKHIHDSRLEGSKLEEMHQVLPGRARSQIQVLLRELKTEGKIRVQGRTKGARWFPN